MTPTNHSGMPKKPDFTLPPSTSKPAAPCDARTEGESQRKHARTRPSGGRISNYLPSAEENAPAPMGTDTEKTPALINLGERGKPVLDWLGKHVIYSHERGDYFRLNHDGRFVRASEKDLRRHMRQAGMRVMEPLETGFTVFDSALCHCQQFLSVEAAFDLAGHKPGIVNTRGGIGILVPRGASLAVPAKGDFSPWWDFLWELSGQDRVQFDFLLGWLAHSVRDLYSLDPSVGCQSTMLVLVGPPKCGKSFLQILITDLLGGRAADPWLYFRGETAFTKDLAEAPHWAIEDKSPVRSLDRRLTIAGMIKGSLTTTAIELHAKGKDKLSCHTFRRLTMSVNEDSDYATAIPPLDDSVADKLLLVKCSAATMAEDYRENRGRFDRTRPAFLFYLLNEHVTQGEIRDQRFGVRAYCHPEIKELLDSFDTGARFREILDEAFFGNGEDRLIGTQKLTATDLQSKLDGHATLSSQVRQILRNSSELGKLMTRLSKASPSRFWKTASKGKTYWHIAPPDAVAEAPEA